MTFLQIFNGNAEWGEVFSKLSAACRIFEKNRAFDLLKKILFFLSWPNKMHIIKQIHKSKFPEFHKNGLQYLKKENLFLVYLIIVCDGNWHLDIDLWKSEPFSFFSLHNFLGEIKNGRWLNLFKFIRLPSWMSEMNWTHSSTLIRLQL